MPHFVWIEGCGQMACSSYRELTAVLDPIYALTEDQPLRIADAFAELAKGAEKAARPEASRQGPEPEP
jgi:hypothetical protein